MSSNVLDEEQSVRLQLVKKQVFPNRSQAIEEAVTEKLARLEKSRLAQECAKLDPEFEKALAEEGLSEDLAECPENFGGDPLGRPESGTSARTNEQRTQDYLELTQSSYALRRSSARKLGRGSILGRSTRRSSFLGHLRKPFFLAPDDI